MNIEIAIDATMRKVRDAEIETQIKLIQGKRIVRG